MVLILTNPLYLLFKGLSSISQLMIHLKMYQYFFIQKYYSTKSVHSFWCFLSRKKTNRLFYIPSSELVSVVIRSGTTTRLGVERV